MKHFTLLTNKRHILLVLIMLLCSLRVAYADDSGLVTQQITVNVPTAGTLSNIIQSDKMYKITNLKITGSLNADDIRFIRKMAGCYYNGNGSKYDGHLQYLDLGSLNQISYVHSFEVYDENGYRSTLNDCLFPLAYLYNLKTVVLPDLYKDYNFSLMGCRNLTTAKMPDNLEKIGNNTFKDCSSLVDISLSPTITSIGEYAFSGCSSLTDIQIPVNVTYIGQYAFYGCSSLKGINVPTDFVNISASTFENCANLQYFFNYNYIESIGDRAFAGCSKLSWIANLLLGTPSIGTYVFENCKSLKSVRVPENIKTLPLGMFKGCSSLSSIALPQYLLSIDDYAFHICNKLESFYFKGGVPTTLSEALIPTTCIIYVPTEYLQDYKDALGADYKYVYTWNPNGSGDGDKPITKCITPTVSYESGELKFACETAGAKYHYTISDKDMATDAYCENGKVALSAAYEISVYATADGYSASEKAQATLYWLNANLKDATNINMAKTRGVVASAHDGIVSVSGLDNGEEVKFYAADGKFIGQAVAANGTASYAVSEALVIAKVGNNSIKIAMK